MKNILIVDDEIFIRESIQDYLEMYNYNVLTAQNGEEAFNVIENKTIDFVISDIRMPKKDGVWLLDQIRKKYPDIPAVLLVTGQADITKKEAIKKGAVDLIIKPIDLEKIVNDLDRYFNKH